MTLDPCFDIHRNLKFRRFLSPNFPKEGSLMSVPSTVSWLVMMAFSSLERVFGRLNFL